MPTRGTSKILRATRSTQRSTAHERVSLTDRRRDVHTERVSRMVPAGGGLTGVYRQRKKRSGGGNDHGDVAKVATKRSKNKLPQQQRTPDGCHGGEDDRDEEELRRFDMDMAYGPCIGVTRLRRWERAAAMGLNPPPRIRDLLLLSCNPLSSSKSSTMATANNSLAVRSGASVSVQLQCIWEGKI